MARAAVLPPSPAKRGTRTAPRSTVTKTTASSQAKVVTEPKRRGVTKTTTARKNPTANVEIDSDDTEDELEMMMREKDEKPARSRGRPPARSAHTASTATSATSAVRGKKPTAAPTSSKANTEDGTGTEVSRKEEPTKKRAGRPRKKPLPETSTVAKSETGPRPRGRPKGSVTAKPSTTARKSTRTVPEPESVAENALTKHIRIASKSTTVRSNILRGPAKKKTVTFEEPSNSESEAPEESNAAAAGQKKAASKTTGKAGLGATPLRKTTGTATRGRKPATAKNSAAKPLSPKKDKQVAKSLASYVSSDGEEDELASAKYNVTSPVKLVIHSPVKSVPEATGLSSPVRRINFTPKKACNVIDENGELKPSTPRNESSGIGSRSPVRKINFTPHRNPAAVPDSGHLALPPGKAVDFSDSIFMSSPARRPEASPFQFSLRDTPNRGLLVRQDVDSAAAPNLDNCPASPLKMSPKKAHLGAIFLQSPNKESSSFSPKTSLIQSPPKRIPSPFKSSLFSSKGSCNTAPILNDEDSTDVPSMSETNTRASTPVGPGYEELAVDDDIDIVEEVARDIFGIELQYYGRSPSISPLPREPTAAEDPLELEPAEDAFEEPVPVEAFADDMDIDGKIKELEQEIRLEPEDFGTICFNTMEDLQKPFENLPDDQSIEHHFVLDGVKDKVETDVEEEEEEVVRSEEVEQADALDIWSAQRSPSPTLESAALETACTSMPSKECLEEYIDLGRRAPGEIEEGGEEDRDIVDENSETDGDIPAPYQAMVNVVLNGETAREAFQAEVIESPQRSTPSIPPSAPTPPNNDMGLASPHDQESAKSKDWLFDINTDPRVASEESYLETTQSDIQSPANHAICDTPTFSENRKSHVNSGIGFTPLARKLDSWEANAPSPSKPSRPRRRGVFSLVGPLERLVEKVKPAEGNVSYPDLEPLSVADEPPLPADLPCQAESKDASPIPQSPRTPESAVTPLENSMVYSPIRLDIFEDPELSDAEESTSEKRQPNSRVESPECSEAHEGDSLPGEDDKENNQIPLIAPGTPIRRGTDHLRTVHTVSKVPLKGEGEVSPLKVPRKRGHSLESRSPTRSSPRVRKPVVLFGTQTVPTFSPHKESRASRSPSPKRRCSTPRRSIGSQPDIQVPQSPSIASSPGKTPRRKSIATQQTLSGAVVFVDVHTTEGEDASGIFVELLQQMGARCFRSWSWNPRSSLSPADGVDPKESKVGITHVVYKDGGLRTLEKVKHAGGLVKCVGVGWVLDCERENKWLDETPYMVDSSIIPRGGAKRRKSMEPRALSNVNGTLVRVAEPSTPSASGRRCGADRGAVEGFRKITPPTPLAGAPSTPVHKSDRYHVPATPGYNFDNLDAVGMSPATPYFLSNRAKLVQKSCPPKQSNRGLFGNIDTPTFSLELDDEAESRRQQRARMEAARRKSHFYMPAVESPLGK